VTEVLGRGVYTVAEAAKLTRLKPSRVREWFRGRGTEPRVFTSDYEPTNGVPVISFLDLVDVFVAGKLRDHGVSLRALRAVYDRLRRDFDTDHPFGRRELSADGKALFLCGLDERGEREMTEALTRRRAYARILAPFFNSIDYDETTGLARRWRIAPGVVVDPAINFGGPTVQARWILTSVLANTYWANDSDVGRVAAWYNTRPEDVRTAVQFEESLAP
jgi:uncharacterized protein (DUF433 family)